MAGTRLAEIDLDKAIYMHKQVDPETRRTDSVWVWSASLVFESPSYAITFVSHAFAASFESSCLDFSLNRNAVNII